MLATHRRINLDDTLRGSARGQTPPGRNVAVRATPAFRACPLPIDKRTVRAVDDGAGIDPEGVSHPNVHCERVDAAPRVSPSGSRRRRVDPAPLAALACLGRGGCLRSREK